MINQVAAIRYAKAYFAYCQTSDSFKEIQIESEKVLGILTNTSGLNKSLKNKVIPNQTKKTILLKALFNISENLKTLVEILVRKKRLYLFDSILYQFIELYKESKGIDTCYLISAKKISKKTQETLKPLIKKISKNKTNIINIIDKDLIGGFIIKVGDIQFDNSVTSSLNKLKRTLKKENEFI